MLVSLFFVVMSLFFSIRSMAHAQEQYQKIISGVMIGISIIFILFDLVHLNQ